MTVVTETGTPLASRETRIRAAAAGDQTAFATLYQEFGPKVYNLVFRSVRNPHLAEDVCQEVWTRAYQKLDELREPAAFSTWLYRIASHACVDRSRRPGGLSPEQELPEQVAAPAYADPESATIRHESERLLWQALGALPTRQHLALFLREVEGKNYQEIAEVLNTTASAVETLLFRARRGVADAFERLQSAGERCGQAKKTMAVLIDGEATTVQRRAIEAHVDECRNCRTTLASQRQVAAAYGALPLFPLPLLLADRIMQGLGTASVATGGGASVLGKLLALVSTKAQLATATLTITGALTLATVAVPGDSPHIDASSAASRASASNASSSSNAAAPSNTQSPGAGVTPDVPSLVLPGVTATAAPVLRALEGLRNLSSGVATLPSVPGAPGDAADLLTPPGVGPGVTPPIVVPGVTPPAAIPNATPPIALPTVQAPNGVPTVSAPNAPLP